MAEVGPQYGGAWGMRRIVGQLQLSKRYETLQTLQDEASAIRPTAHYVCPTIER